MNDMQLDSYYGRLVLEPKFKDQQAQLEYLPTVKAIGRNIKCFRCNGLMPMINGELPNHEFYCRKCLNLGRVSSLYHFATHAEPNLFQTQQHYLAWEGQLTADQARCSQDIIHSIDIKEDRLLWAVTGAGKTEMLFLGIDHALYQGKRIAVASPRVDVILELFPRFSAAFPQAEIALLHGRNDTPYRYTQFVLCTTHQLLRFYHAFDVLIIDEVDSFPFAMNPELHFAARQARKVEGSTIYLTATPDGKLLKQSKTKQLATSYLTRRFHGHPLPEIQLKTCPKWKDKFAKNTLPRALKKFIREQQIAKRQFLIFIPKISMLPDILKVVEKYFPDIRFKTVHAADPLRIEKVQEMRDKKIDALITTTILERGVTFPGIDVAVLGADDPIFSMAALVQIAGRVGRNPKRPGGTVLFIAAMLNTNIKRAQKQIKFMNKKGFK